MSLYREKRVPSWWYTVTVNGQRMHKSTGIRNTMLNKPLAQKVEADDLQKIGVYGPEAVMAKPPVLREFAEAVFLPWVRGSQSLELKSKQCYKTGWRLLRAPFWPTAHGSITKSDCDVSAFPNSNYNANCALCTLRRMFGPAKDEKRIAFEVPTIRKRKVWGRAIAMSNADAEKIASHMSGDPKDAFLTLRATGMRPREGY